MKLIANEINNNYFRNLPELAKQASKLDVAVAYITDDTIFKNAFESNIAVNIWCRVDDNVSLKTLNILRSCMNNPKCKLWLTYDFLHAKVIWFHNVGCYIGSANLSSKALYNNIELGVFFEETPDYDNFYQEIKAFFNSLSSRYTTAILKNDLENIIKIFEGMEQDEQIKDLKKKLKNRGEIHLEKWNKLKKELFSNQKQPLREISKTSISKKNFTDEWKNTINLLIEYKEYYIKNFKRPSWISKDVSYLSELDKIFDWYYEYHIRGDKKIEIIVEEMHQQNLNSRDQNI